MSDIAIKVENISKIYRIGAKEEKYKTLSGKITSFIKSPFNNFKRLRSLSNFDLSKENEDIIWALKDISFEVKRGEVLGIIGRNGAGKSTLLKILAQITEPSSGRIEIYGRIASLLEVGTGFNPELTGRENVYLNGTILGMRKKEIDRKFDEIVDFSGVEKFIDTPVKRYSSGMRVRLAFAVAAFLEPEILLIDEVLAVGDAEFQKKCLGKMDEVAKGGKTVLFVSHNMGAVLSLCGNGLLLNEGKVTNYGNITEITYNYHKLFSSINKIVEWDFDNAPGNQIIKFLSIEIIYENEMLRSGDGIQFIFIFFNELSNCQLDVTFHLLDEIGNLVFVGSTSSDMLNYFNQGYIKAICKVPPHLLNEGTYTIYRLLMVQNRGTILHEERNVISFEVFPQENKDFGWKGKKEGVVKPKLQWEIQSYL